MTRSLETLLTAVFVAGVALGVAPGCSADPARPSLIQVGGQSAAAAGGGSNAGRGGTSDGTPTGSDSGAAGDASGGAADGGEGGSQGPLDSGGAPPVVPASACSKTAKWSSPTSIGDVSSADGETLLSVTPDELDLAFVRKGALYVAHRSKVDGDFVIGEPVTIPAGWTVDAGAALSADGKRLVLSGDGESKLGELTRTNRSIAFGDEVDTTAYAQVNQDALYTGKIYASPVVSAGDDQLFYNSAFPDGGSSVVVSTRSGSEAWSAPVALANGALDGKKGVRRLPTGISADARTLFYFNEESLSEEARFRDTPQASAPLYDILSLGKRRGAAPNSACDRLYSQSGSDVVVEKD